MKGKPFEAEAIRTQITPKLGLQSLGGRFVHLVLNRDMQAWGMSVLRTQHPMKALGDMLMQREHFGGLHCQCRATPQIHDTGNLGHRRFQPGQLAEQGADFFFS